MCTAGGAGQAEQKDLLPLPAAELAVSVLCTWASQRVDDHCACHLTTCVVVPLGIAGGPGQAEQADRLLRSASTSAAAEHAARAVDELMAAASNAAERAAEFESAWDTAVMSLLRDGMHGSSGGSTAGTSGV